MEVYRTLFEISKLLLSSEREPDRLIELLLRRVVELTSAERGFIVVREEGSFVQKFQVRYDRELVSPPERQFSRSLVQEAIVRQELLYVPDVLDDPRLSDKASIQLLGHSSALVAPLRHENEVHGVVYLERSSGETGFPEPARRFLAEFADVAALSILRALEQHRLRRRNLMLERDLFARHDFAGIVTQNPKMLQLLKMIGQVADSEASILIRGETGSGKELVARAIHLNSLRQEEPFVTLDCTALPGPLLESELFGHVKGAFTGAQKDRAGRLATADGGTLFLDEAGELSLELQARLLRFLQFGELQPVGSDRTRSVDVRILAATHRDLPQRVQEGLFRQDLYYRLRVVELNLPSLRERRGDIPLLLEHFVKQYWKRKGPAPQWSEAAARALQRYDYPGNIRELQHAVQRACLLATGAVLGPELLPDEIAAAAQGPASRFSEYTNEELKQARADAAQEAEHDFLEGLLARSGGNVSEAARIAGMRRTYLHKLLARHRSSES